MTMGGVWFAMIVSLSLHQVYARDCMNLNDIDNCDECIRCGAIWCYNPTDEEPRCSLGDDAWCPKYKQQLLVLPSESGILTLDSLRHDRSVKVAGSADTVVFVSKGKQITKAEVKITFVNSTIQNLDHNRNFLIDSTVRYNPITGNEITIIGKPKTDFCPLSGSDKEFITMKIQIEKDESAEEATIRYHVPCSCGCKTEPKSRSCSGKGTLSCGACECDKGWEGRDCSIKANQTIPNCGDRGDIEGCYPRGGGDLCSNNGQCKCGGVCICDKNKIGSHYFDEQCTDICTTSSFCDACILNPQEGQSCSFCPDSMFADPLNKTLLDKKDDFGRQVWIECSIRANDSCEIQYVAMKDDDETHIMIVDSCKAIVPGAYVAGMGSINVLPIVLGVIAALAITAAVVGYMFWKNRTPPLPPNDSLYHNIDAEDCTGENPLYKSPTSFFKNPTYQKW